jgi:glyoxylase-like metal-dependent hydrolase (beta-lactamase superfamily II)
MTFQERQLGAGFWCFEQAGTRCFLLQGEPFSLLVDACWQGELRKLCEEKTGNLVHLVLTHGDRDHVGCLEQFATRFMHPAEFSTAEARSGVKARMTPIWDGQVLDLGTTSLEVLHLPGHTPGSIALLDRSRRVLIAGDSVQAAPIYMFGTGRNLAALRDSMARLKRRSGDFDFIYASHGELALDSGIVDELHVLADEICQGLLPEPLPAPRPGPPSMPEDVHLYRRGRVQLVF